MEQQIANYVSTIIKDRNISTYYLSKRGINNVTLDRILQRNNSKGTSYTLNTLKTLLLALDVKEVELKIDNNTIKIKL